VVGPSRTSTGTLLRDLAEIAVEAQGAEAFRYHALNRLIQMVGADSGCYSSMGNKPMDLAATLIGFEAPVAELVHNMSEISPEEILRSLAPRTQEDTDVVPASRRDRLFLYREFLPNFGIRRYGVRGWLADKRICFITFARSGAHDQSRFISRAAPMLDAVFPIFVLGERAHRRAQRAAHLPVPEILAALTACESKVVDLLERGLTNREIASLLGLSPNTVRNRVASAFKRVGASRRAELVYLLRSGT